VRHRTATRTLVIGLALALAPALGCGPQDPSTNNANNTSNNENNTTNNSENNGTSNNTTTTDTSTTNTTNNNNNVCQLDANCNDPNLVCEQMECVPSCESSADCTDAGTECLPRAGADGFACQPIPSNIQDKLDGTCDFSTEEFVGQVSSEKDMAHGGGQPAVGDQSNFADDSGIASLITDHIATLPTRDDDSTSDVEENAKTFADGMEPTITEAMVVATFNKPDDAGQPDFGNIRFYLQDKKDAIQIFLPRDFTLEDTDGNAVQIEVGQKVSFKVEEVKNFNGTPEITDLSEFTVAQETGDMVDVPVLDLTGEELTEDDYLKLARVEGKITGLERANCGSGNLCWTLEHGGVGSTFRSRSSFIAIGDCVRYLGPIGSFPGPVNNGDATINYQLDTVNFDWYVSFAPNFQ
jgi:hypothetical protein